MQKCPYCTAEIADEALKCRYCGEWVKEPPARRIGDDQALGRAANRFVSFSVVMAIAGVVLALLFFFLFFLPAWNERRKGFEDFDRRIERNGTPPARDR